MKTKTSTADGVTLGRVRALLRSWEALDPSAFPAVRYYAAKLRESLGDRAPKPEK